MTGINYGRQAGFTLVELVMTIVLLGILSATALPRFADLGGAADEVTFQAVRSNFKTGVALVYSTSLVKKVRSTTGYPDVSLEGNCVMVNSATGYPLVDQTTGTCTPVAMSKPLQNLPSMAEKLYAHLQGVSLIPVANAAPPAPPAPDPTPGAADAELPGLLMEGDFTDWTWAKSAPNATLSNAKGSSFTYSQDTGITN